MTESIDLDAYFARIGYDGAGEPTLQSLRALHALHPRAIPFENLDVLLGRPIKVDLASVQAKLVAGRRGGYCFEHNALFSAVLKALGFAVTDLGARVMWQRPDGTPAARTHRLLRVETPDGPFHADVGFGGITQTAPLRLEPGVAQDTGAGIFRLQPDEGDELTLQFLLPSGWSSVYRFNPMAHHPIDYEMSNWFVSTHPGSVFTSNLMAAWVGEDRRYALMNNQLSVYRDDGVIEKHALTPQALEVLLHDTFGLTRPADDETLRALYAGLPSHTLSR